MQSERVARYLLDRGSITADQYEKARRTKEFFGGQLVSHLLKLGFVSEAALGEALSAINGAPYAALEHLRAIPSETLATVPVKLIEQHRVCPFRIEDRTLRVAMLDPRNRNAILEVQIASGYSVEPWVTSEYRLHQAIERHYGVRLAGMKSISLAPPSTPARGAEAAASASRDVVAPAGPEVGLDGRPLDDDVSFEDYLYTAPLVAADREDSGVPVAAAAPAAPDPSAERPAIERAAIGPMTLEDLDAALGAATARDEVAGPVLRFCSGFAARVGIFALGKDGIRGIAGSGRSFETPVVRKVVVPAGAGTVFDTALRSRDFFYGAVPALPPNRDLFTLLGGRLPATAMVLPILVKDRTAALLYLDGDDAPLAKPDIPLMRRVAAKAGLAFEIVLLRSKLREI